MTNPVGSNCNHWVAAFAAALLLFVGGCAFVEVEGQYSARYGSDFTLVIPRTALRSPGYFFTSIPRPASHADTILVMYARKSDSLWFYKLGEVHHFQSIGLREYGVHEVSSMFWNESESTLYVLDERQAALLELDTEGSVLALDSLPYFTDSDDVVYGSVMEFVANKKNVISVVGAFTTVDSFVQRPCLARYDRHLRTWTPIAWHPVDIRQHPNRFSFYPLLNATSGNLDSVFFRFRVSDSVFLYSNGRMSSYLSSSLPGIQYQELQPPEIDSPEFFIIAPTYWWLTISNGAFITLGWDRIDLHERDGSLNSVYSKRIFLLVTPKSGEKTSVIRLPSKYSIYNPWLFSVGEGFAIIDKTKQDPNDKSHVVYTLINIENE